MTSSKSNFWFKIKRIDTLRLPKDISEIHKARNAIKSVVFHNVTKVALNGCVLTAQKSIK